jgi:hypothetical protein
MLDATFSGFPHGKLIKMLAKPSNTSLQVLKRQLYNNTASVPSRCSDGAHGHLGIVLDADWYLAVSGNIICSVWEHHLGHSQTSGQQPKPHACYYCCSTQTGHLSIQE